MKLIAALACALVLSACSNSSNDPYGHAGTNGATGTGTGAGNGPASTPEKNETGVDTSRPGSLTAHAWCANGEQQGQAYQIRLNFINSEDFDTHVYSLKAGRRDAEIPNAGQQGNYSINGSNITVTVNGQSETYTIRLDPRDATTGAEKLHIGDAAYDPCN